MRFVKYAIVILGVLAIKANAEIVVQGSAAFIDGDTLEVSGQSVRLEGIDAAELGQRCVAPGRKFVRPGETAAKRLSELAQDGVICAGTGYDDYKRLIATCRTAAGANINQQLVREGQAWAFVKFTDTYKPDEEIARSAGLGIWNMKCETPWAFRATTWKSARKKLSTDCPIKGNISERGKIYHTPWSPHYASTKINEAKGERWFCSEAEALEAGWRLPLR
jgi:endonuclease YncB( thermonuclease family)